MLNFRKPLTRIHFPSLNSLPLGGPCFNSAIQVVSFCGLKPRCGQHLNLCRARLQPCRNVCKINTALAAGQLGIESRLRLFRPWSFRVKPQMRRCVSSGLMSRPPKQLFLGDAIQIWTIPVAANNSVQSEARRVYNGANSIVTTQISLETLQTRTRSERECSVQVTN
jgi:hypothetical protein